MGNKNYSKFSQHFNKNKKNSTDVTAGLVTIDELITDNSVTETSQEAKNIVETVSGVVSGCEILNIRKEPNKESDIMMTINKNTELIINMSELTSEDFYKICTASGIEGYCMKKFITIK